MKYRYSQKLVDIFKLLTGKYLRGAFGRYYRVTKYENSEKEYIQLGFSGYLKPPANLGWAWKILDLYELFS